MLTFIQVFIRVRTAYLLRSVIGNGVSITIRQWRSISHIAMVVHIILERLSLRDLHFLVMRT